MNDKKPTVLVPGIQQGNCSRPFVDFAELSFDARRAYYHFLMSVKQMRAADAFRCACEAYPDDGLSTAMPLAKHDTQYRATFRQ